MLMKVKMFNKSFLFILSSSVIKGEENRNSIGMIKILFLTLNISLGSRLG